MNNHISCQSHCCKYHGCKYLFDDCPVNLGKVEQDNPCESCEFDSSINNNYDDKTVILSDKTLHLLKQILIFDDNKNQSKDELIYNYCLYAFNKSE